MIALGIDPGLTGAVAAIDSRTGAVVIVDMPTKETGGGGLVQRRIDGRALAELIRTLAPADQSAIVTCEAVHAIAGKREGQGGMQQMGSLMRTFGAIEAILDAMRFEPQPQYVAPRRWKKFYDLDGEKAKGLDTARRLFPGARSLLARVKDHNRAEALLLAQYGLARHA